MLIKPTFIKAAAIASSDDNRQQKGKYPTYNRYRPLKQGFTQRNYQSLLFASFLALCLAMKRSCQILGSPDA